MTDAADAAPTTEPPIEPGAPVSTHLRALARIARQDHLRGGAGDWKRSNQLAVLRAFFDAIRRPSAALARDPDTLFAAAGQGFLDHLDRGAQRAGYSSAGARRREALASFAAAFRRLLDGPYRGDSRALLADERTLSSAFLAFLRELQAQAPEAPDDDPPTEEAPE